MNRPSSVLYITDREREVLNLAGEGYSTKEIGKILHIESETVKTHRKHILAKMNARNMTHAVAMHLLGEVPKIEGQKTISQVRLNYRLKMLINKYGNALNAELEELLKQAMKG